MRKFSLTTQITGAMLVGVVLGAVWPKLAQDLSIIGEIFLRLIQMGVVLMIFGAVIEALGSLKPQDLGRLGLKTGYWFFVTTVLAALLGIGGGLILQPGKVADLAQFAGTKFKGPAATNFHDTVLNFFPTNIFNSLSSGNVIQVLVFASLFGVVLSRANVQGNYQRVLELVKQVNQLVVKMVMLVMKLAPLGIASLVATALATNGSQVLLPLVRFLGDYALLTVLFVGGLFCFTSWYAKVPLLSLVKGFSEIIVVAFTTTSSAVALPVEMKVARDKLGVSQPVSQLVLPLGMALNSNGLALYLSLVCVTLMQLMGTSLTLGMLGKVVVLAILSCLGTVVVPGGGLVALTIMVPALGMPVASIGLFAGIDWFVGMFRTVANVVGDTTTAIGVAASDDQLQRTVYQTKSSKMKQAKQAS